MDQIPLATSWYIIKFNPTPNPTAPPTIHIRGIQRTAPPPPFPIREAVELELTGDDGGNTEEGNTENDESPRTPIREVVLLKFTGFWKSPFRASQLHVKS